MRKNMKVGLVGLCQVNFLGDKEAAFERARAGLGDFCAHLGLSFVAYDTLPVTRDDSERAAAWAKAQNVDFLMVHMSSYAAGETILELSAAAPYIGIWATPEPVNEGFLQLNSYCAINMMGSILTHYKPVRHKYFYGWADDAAFRERFSVTACAVGALVRLPGTKVALVGGIAPGFNDLYFDERDWHRRLGIEIHRGIEFSDVLERAERLSDAAVKEYAQLCASGYAQIEPQVAEAMDNHGRLFGGYYELAKENGYEALGVSCWPRLQGSRNMLACSTIGKLNEHGIPSACEGDLPGAVSMLLLSWMGESVTTLLDLVAHDPVDETVQLWHCGPTAVCLSGPEGASMRRYCERRTDGVDRRCAINDLTLAPVAGSVFRITGECDRAFVLTGEMIRCKKPSFLGSRGWFGSMKLADQHIGANDLIHTIQTAGFQHHYPYVPIALGDALMELCAWLGLTPLAPIPYKPYLCCGQDGEKAR